MSHTIAVYKFGGASIKDAASVRNMFTIVSQANTTHLIIVVSAMGKVTNALEGLLQTAYQGNDNTDYTIHLKQIKTFHLDIAKQLFPPQNKVFAGLETLFTELKNIAKHINSFTDFNEAYDAMVPYGELLSSTLLSHFFEHKAMPCTWQDARQCIITDSRHRNANIQLSATYNSIRTTFNKPQRYITQGFIGSNEQGHSTTLGREGSDYSAALIAAALAASDVRIWKDVDGVFSADPRLFSKARIIEQLSYKEAIEMAYFGAGVLHPKTMAPLTQQHIPLRVCSFLHPHLEGSVIHDKAKPMPLCVIVKRHLFLLSITSLAYDMVNEQHKQTVFNILYQKGAVVLSSQQIALSLSICVDIGTATIESIIKPLRQAYKVRYNSQQMLISMRHYTKAHLAAITPLLSAAKMEQKDRHNYHFVIDDKADAKPILAQLNALL